MKSLLDFIKKVERTKGFGGAGEAYGVLTSLSLEAKRVLAAFYENMPSPNSDTCKDCWDNGKNSSYSVQMGDGIWKCPQCGDTIVL